jgi:hypothetical protein
MGLLSSGTARLPVPTPPLLVSDGHDLDDILAPQLVNDGVGEPRHDVIVHDPGRWQARDERPTQRRFGDGVEGVADGV